MEDEAGSHKVCGNSFRPIHESSYNQSPRILKPYLEHAAGKGGIVSVELPVRRAQHRLPAITDLSSLSAYARDRGLRLHLDGARILIATAWTGQSLRYYASLFDTMYISLFKCLGASGGAMLCGPKVV